MFAMILTTTTSSNRTNASHSPPVSSSSSSVAAAAASAANMSMIEEDPVNTTTGTGAVTTDEPFPPHVDVTNIVINPESPSSKKQTLKTFNEVNTLIQSNRKREVKIILRENAWPLNNGIRAHLWPALCQQHTSAKNIFTKAEDGFYWAMVTSLFGTVGKNDNDNKKNTIKGFEEKGITFPSKATPSQIVQLIDESKAASIFFFFFYFICYLIKVIKLIKLMK